jgi:putative phosphoserine phosphatase/1-acylglycerol-3-phosphate O-acyltransferase
MAYIISANKGYLGGFSEHYMENIAMDFFNSDIEHRISKRGFTRLTEHKMKGHRVVLLSGMPEFLLRNYSRLFKVKEFYGSVMEINDGKFTGKTVGVFPIVKGKSEVVEKILKKYNLDWRHVTAYADHYHDRYLLKKVGQPVAVNPDDRLKAIAEKSNWQIEYFDS